MAHISAAWPRLTVFCLLWLLTGATFAATAGETRVMVSGELEIPVTVYPAEGDRVLLWLPSEHGLQQSHAALAQALAARGLESWLADLYAAYFLPVGPSAVEDFEPSVVADLIKAVRESTGKQVILASHDRGAITVLEGARAWQLAHPDDDALGSAVLVSPYLLVGTPEPGQTAEYRPIASATNLPLYLVQPERSPLYWHLPELKQRLQSGGSDVFTQVLPGQRDRFFFRPDAVEAERAAGERLPATINNAVHLLATQPAARRAVPITDTPAEVASPPRELSLQPYRGDPQPPPLKGPDLAGQQHRLSDYTGRVVLVNFWASWCPPCVHEMPSMQRLADRFAGKPFDILAVNLAEEPDAVKAFVEELDLEFTVLLDPEGQSIKDWKVFAYPTSYVIGKDGRVRYALFGAIDWLDVETVRKIEALLQE